MQHIDGFDGFLGQRIQIVVEGVIGLSRGRVLVDLGLLRVRT